jgi:hypothetical protein
MVFRDEGATSVFELRSGGVVEPRDFATRKVSPIPKGEVLVGLDRTGD